MPYVNLGIAHERYRRFLGSLGLSTTAMTVAPSLGS